MQSNSRHTHIASILIKLEPLLLCYWVYHCCPTLPHSSTAQHSPNGWYKTLPPKYSFNAVAVSKLPILSAQPTSKNIVRSQKKKKKVNVTKAPSSFFFPERCFHSMYSVCFIWASFSCKNIARLLPWQRRLLYVYHTIDAKQFGPVFFYYYSFRS